MQAQKNMFCDIVKFCVNNSKYELYSEVDSDAKDSNLTYISKLTIPNGILDIYCDELSGKQTYILYWRNIGKVHKNRLNRDELMNELNKIIQCCV